MAKKRKVIKLDASGQSVGRLATQIATILMGKHKADFLPHLDSGDKVAIENVAEAVFTGKKAQVKEYKSHSMHPGGLKIRLAKNLSKESPEEIIKHAVYRMLPKNKLREQRMLRLSFK